MRPVKYPINRYFKGAGRTVWLNEAGKPALMKGKSMTPQQKIKHMVLTIIAAWNEAQPPQFDGAAVDEAWEGADDEQVQDALNEVRTTGIETGLPHDWSRHYESEAVAKQAADGSWVGWTYWHGGGKHGEPEAIDWISDAYDVACAEEQKMVTVRTFTKPEARAAQ